MKFLPVVVRELAVAVRRPMTYRMRVAAAAVFILVIGFTLLTVPSHIPLAEQGRVLFSMLSSVAFYYCLFAGARVTADCISEEKREQTLGLLFLTDLKGYDVVLGKMAASSVNSFYGLLAVIPMLALALFLGGLTVGQVARVALVLGNTLFFSLSAGLFISTMSRNERKAMFGTACLAALVAFGPYGLANYVTQDFPKSSFADLDPGFLLSSPYFAFDLARGQTTTVNVLAREFITSMAFVQLLSWGLLAIASILLPKSCEDRPLHTKWFGWHGLWHRWSYGDSVSRKAFRTRLLDRNPFLWLAGRDRLKPSYVWLFLLILSAVWYWGFSRYREVIFDWMTSIWLVFFVHGFLKIWFISEVSARFVEDRRSGALELLLSSPLSVREILRGQKLALRRQFAQPVFVVIVLDLLLLWAGLHSFTWNATRSGLVSLYAAGIFTLVTDLITLRWVGMWTALNARGTNRAILATALRVLVLPWIVMGAWLAAIGFWAQLAGPMPFRLTLEFYTAIWVALGMVNNLLFGLWARDRLLRDFRVVATQQADSGMTSSWWPSRPEPIEPVRPLALSSGE